MALLFELLLLELEQIQIRAQTGCEEDLCRADLFDGACGDDKP